MFDFCINGGGMVGANLAIGLAKQGFQVAVIEAHMPNPYSAEQLPDDRMSAISLASVQLLESLGSWEPVTQMRSRRYDMLSVWEDEGARTDFCAADLGLPELGFFVENRLIQLAAHQALSNFDNVTWFRDSHVETFDLSPHTHNELTFSNGETLRCKWLIGADGAMSRVRQAAKIGVTGWQYRQHAMGIVVEMAEPTPNVTWQQFFPSGPRAYLPMHDKYAALIWYDEAQRVAALKKLPLASLKAEIQSRFSPQLGDFSIIKTSSFPLTRQHAQRYVKPGVIILGDAAHTINPLAGQGVNIGFRDVAALLAVTATFSARGIGKAQDDFFAALQGEFELPRRRDNLLMMSAMDGFYAAFSNDKLPLKWLRNQAFKVAQNAGPLKQQVLKYALGVNG